MQSNAYPWLIGLLLAGAAASCSFDQRPVTKSPRPATTMPPAAAPETLGRPALPRLSQEGMVQQPAMKAALGQSRPPHRAAKAPAALVAAQAGARRLPPRRPPHMCSQAMLGMEAAKARAVPRLDSTDNNIQAFCAQAAPAVQVFRVRAGRDTVLVGQQGTRLVVPACAFDVPASGGPVELRLREFYSTADIVLAGLGTRAGLDLLETGGMLHLAAAADGRPVRLRPGKQLLVQLPTKQQLPGMQLFEGVSHDARRAPDWRLPIATKAGRAQKQPSSDRWPSLPKGNGTLQPILDHLAPLSAADVARVAQLRPANKDERRWWRTIGRNKHLAIKHVLNLSLMADSMGAIQSAYLWQGDSVLGKAMAAAAKKLPLLRPGSYLEAAAPYRRRPVAARGNLHIIYTRTGRRLAYIYWQSLLKPTWTRQEMQRGRAEFAQQFNSKSTDSAPLTLDSGLCYELAAGGLGWINCDRLLDPGPRIEYAVQAPAPATVVSLVFKGQRSILASSRTEGNSAVFEQVPSGQAATIVALRCDKGITYLATTAVSLGQAAPPDLQFRPVSLEQLRTELASL